MPIAADTKTKIIQSNKLHEKDSGSPEVQIAVLTASIKELTTHMQRHSKDYASRRGLLLQVNRRNKLMRYLSKVSTERYHQIADKLGLRK